MIELSGLHGIWLGPDHLANSKITLFYPNGPTQIIQYKSGEYAQAEKDKNTLEEAKKEFDKAQIECRDEEVAADVHSGKVATEPHVRISQLSRNGSKESPSASPCELR
jgi:hypothetical protein